MVYPDRIGSRFALPKKNSSAHKWFYYPEMKMEECLMFSCTLAEDCKSNQAIQAWSYRMPTWAGTSFQHFYLSTQILGSKNRVYSFVVLDDLKSSFYHVIDEFVSSVQKILADWPPKHAFFNALVGRKLVSFFIALRLSKKSDGKWWEIIRTLNRAMINVKFTWLLTRSCTVRFWQSPRWSSLCFPLRFWWPNRFQRYSSTLDRGTSNRNLQRISDGQVTLLLQKTCSFCL